MDAFINWWMENIPLSPKISVFFISMIPVVEERGGLILAKMLGIPMWESIFLCALGNIIPIPFLVLGMEHILHWLDRHNFSRIVSWIMEKARRNKSKIDRYGALGLVLFVGIPMPGTGAWTGSLVASVFDMDVKRAMVSMLLGVFMAATIMSFILYGLIELVI